LLANIAFVEALIAVELVIALPLAVRSQHRRPTWREWIAASNVVAGIGLFLSAGEPTGSTADPSLTVWALIAQTVCNQYRRPFSDDSS
jgi:drug/metabolite transporter (DMT)-like permease